MRRASTRRRSHGSALDSTPYLEFSLSPLSEPMSIPLPEGVVAMEGEIVTTQEEMDAFMVVRAILAEVVEVDRIVIRDTKSYCGVLLDDNNRKPLCRLRFNAKQWYLGVFDEEKVETRIPIERIEDIYSHAAKLRETVAYY